MKKIFTGCLITAAIILTVAMIVSVIVFYNYLNKPNKINFAKEPIPNATVSKRLDFDGKDIPGFIKNEPKENILYQALLVSSQGFSDIVTYKQVVKMSKPVKLNKKLPVKAEDFELVNSNSLLPNITHYPMYELPEDNEIPIMDMLTIYSKTDSVYLYLQEGYYSVNYYQIDKVGSFGEVIIYDAKSKLLYFTRKRFFAFQ